MNVDPSEFIWCNGEFVPWEDAKVHVLTHGLHYGTGVFEGIRCYETELGPAIFRHEDHLDRLEPSAKLYYIPIPSQPAAPRGPTPGLIPPNRPSSCSIRPLLYPGHAPT